MAFHPSKSIMAPTPLEQLLEEINFQRTKEMRQLLKDDSGFVMVQGTTYWTDLFVRHFLFQSDKSIDCDDLLFFVRKRHIKSSSRYLPKFETEVDVYRKDSKKLPIGDPDIDWEETVYLNLIIHQFDYTLTLAICTRTSPKQLQVLRRHSQKVYASPSRRRMDAKGEFEEMTYPHVCFMVDNFAEVFGDIQVRDGEMVCVELVASDRLGSIQSVIFLGSIRYDALKRVYEARQSSLSTKMAHRMTFGLFNGPSSNQRFEFVRMKGPQGKGHAEMAVTRPKGCSGVETPTSEPGFCATDMWDSDYEEDAEEMFVKRHQRRLSDPSSNLNHFALGGWKMTKIDSAAAKSRSENEGLDTVDNGISEIEAGDLRDDTATGPASSSFTTTSREGCCGCWSKQRRGSLSLSEVYCGRCQATAETIRAPIGPPEARCPCDGPQPQSPFRAKHRQRLLQLRKKSEKMKATKELEIGDDATSLDKDCNNSGEVKYESKTADNGVYIVVKGKEELPSTTHVLHSELENKLSKIDENNYCAVSESNLDNIMTRSMGSTPVTNSLDLDKLNLNKINTYCTLPKRHKRGKAHTHGPPHRVTKDGTHIYYWCDMPKKSELDDGAYNPLWTMRGFTQTFHFWKENKRAQSSPLNAFLTYITLPWWSIAKDILDHREGPILTF